MNWADWAIVAAILMSAVIAAAQGFFVEVFALAGAVFGYIAAAWGCRQVGEWFLPYVKTAEVANLAGFLTILFAVMVLAGVAGRLARWALKEAGLRWVDRILGGAFGLVRGLVVVTVVLLAVAAFDPQSRPLRDSQLAGYFLVVGRAASWLAPAEIRQKFRQGVAALRNAPKNGDRPLETKEH